MVPGIGSSWDPKVSGFWLPRCVPNKVMKLTSHGQVALPVSVPGSNCYRCMLRSQPCSAQRMAVNEALEHGKATRSCPVKLA